jgi:hypothetical protein
MDFPAVSADEALGTRQHFLCSAPGESQKENSLWLDSAVYQMCNPVDQRSGFSGAGARNDQKWTVAVCCSCGLLRIQVGREFAC